jgi:hypothetical protein
MVTKSVRGWIALALIGAAVPLAYGQAQAEPQAAPLKVRVVEAGDAPRYYAVVEELAAPPQSEYWLGISIGELPPVAKTQLGIEHGLVVDDVMPDSPAAKAGIQVHDILKIANGKGLQAAEDILKAVDDAKESELELVLLRSHKELTVKVKPAKRPDQEVRKTETAPAPRDGIAAEIGKLEEAIQSLRSRIGNDPLGIWFAKPGVVAEARRPAEFPKDLKVQIMKQGDMPAKIHVEHQGKEWDITEEQLGDLPEEIRGHVQTMLGKGPFGLRMKLPTVVPPPVAAPHPGQPVPTPPTAGPRNVVPPSGADPAVTRLRAYRVDTKDEALEAKLDQILKKLDQMENKALEALRDEVKQLRKELDELRSK